MNILVLGRWTQVSTQKGLKMQRVEDRYFMY